MMFMMVNPDQPVGYPVYNQYNQHSNMLMAMPSNLPSNVSFSFQNGAHVMNVPQMIPNQVESVAKINKETSSNVSPRNGTYMCLKMALENHLSNNELMEIIRGRAVKLSKKRDENKHMQKVIERISKSQAIEILSEFKGCILECSEHVYANYVLQKLLQTLPSEAISFVFRYISNNGYFVRQSKNRSACRVVQRLIENAAPHQVEQMINLVVANFEELSMDQFGNFVVQSAFESGCHFLELQEQLEAQLHARAPKIAKSDTGCCVLIKYLGCHEYLNRQVIAEDILSDVGLVTLMELTPKGRFAIRCAKTICVQE